MESDLRPEGKWMMRGSGADGTPFRIAASNAHAGFCSRALGIPQEDLTQSAVSLNLDEKEGVIAVRQTDWGLCDRGLRAGLAAGLKFSVGLEAYAVDPAASLSLRK
jgi:hypothetical protein